MKIEILIIVKKGTSQQWRKENLQFLKMLIYTIFLIKRMYLCRVWIYGSELGNNFALGVFFPFSVSGLFRTQFSRRRAKKLTLVENWPKAPTQEGKKGAASARFLSFLQDLSDSSTQKLGFHIREVSTACCCKALRHNKFPFFKWFRWRVRSRKAVPAFCWHSFIWIVALFVLKTSSLRIAWATLADRQLNLQEVLGDRYLISKCIDKKCKI